MKAWPALPTTRGRYLLSNAVEGSEALILSHLLPAAEKGVLFVARDDARMENLRQGLAFFAPHAEVQVLPAWDCLPYDRISPNAAITSQRINTLSGLALQGGLNKNQILITTVNALVQRVVPRANLKEALLYGKVGATMQREELSRFMVNNGYIQVGKVNEPGEYALRGSIVDIFPPGEEAALRLDFFGDTLDTIRRFDPLTQVSSGAIKEFTLRPASEVMLSPDVITRFRSNYRELFGAVAKEDPLYEAVSECRKYAGMEHWLPLYYDTLENVFDYVPGAAVCLDALVMEAQHEREEQVMDYYDARAKALKEKALQGATPYNPVPPDQLYCDEACWEKEAGARSWLQLHPFAAEKAEGNQVIELPLRKGRNYAAESSRQKMTALGMLRHDVQEAAREGQRTIITCYSEGSQARLAGMLKDHELHAKPLEGWKACLHMEPGLAGLVVLGLEHGFAAPDITLVSEQDVLGEKIQRQRARSRTSDKFLAEASNLNEGEFVVHAEHGIGRFEGLETITVGGTAHDCLRLVYAGGDKLYVPVENIDVVTRYGGEETTAELDKLGGAGWQERKARLKNRIRMIAVELLKVAAERATRHAPQFAPAPGAYEEFCARFPYAETDDQLRAIDDVTADLAGGKPMDRLVCGDVGFGKTEVALRAAFMVAWRTEAQQCQQVAVITPTTLLCRQHYQTFTKRFAGLPIRIRQLSRLVSSKEAAETRKGLEEGGVDIIIGTHALLSDKVKFKNLSMVIIDEEQHFGVAQKEKLKKLRAETHVLALSATPIPRTLQMSLAGIRELSLIATPPVDRLAVRTYVMPFDPMIVREAILREHYRGGRTFYVCPRIHDLAEVEKRVRELVPEVKVVVAHGQMAPAELDNIMNAFYDGKYDVLIATTIVESGLDIPSANTLIVHRADMLGLSQLYQIRGRVGRSKVRAYAYLTLPQRKMVTPQAMRRLEVMQSLDTLGAGFSIASHDMDIRGFGNLLGDEQSGHIREVGIELYQTMLEEAVNDLRAEQKGGGTKDDFSPQINLGTSVLIPETYVADLPLRLGLYRRVAALKSEDEVEAIAAEMIDRFGPLPAEVENLLSVMKIKQVCIRAGIEKLDAGPKGMVLGFRNNSFANPDALIDYMTKRPQSVKLRADQRLVIMDKNWDEMPVRVKGVGDILGQIAALAA